LARFVAGLVLGAAKLTKIFRNPADSILDTWSKMDVSRVAFKGLIY